MAGIPYRDRLLLHKILRWILIALAALLVLGVVVTLYLEPYITYDREGAHLTMESLPDSTHRQEASHSTEDIDVSIVYETGGGAGYSMAENGGYYITTSMLQQPEEVLEAVKRLDSSTVVMLEVKSIFGNFYYSTKLEGASLADVDIAVVDQLIAYLNGHGFYTVAVVPAFRDSRFALQNVQCGLPLSGGALWQDEAGCYWLDPADETVQTYLKQLARELSGMGFREVAFSEFYFPESSRIAYSTDVTKEELVASAARELTAYYTGTSLTISFVTEDTDFPAQECSGRIYVPNVDGTSAERYLQAYETGNQSEVVFLANSRDVRLEELAVLRPLLTQ